jgi:steroid 5-alpha reductase family enzyme
MNLLQPLGISAILILIIMSLVWLLSLLRKDMSVVDSFWGLGFIAVTLHFAYRLGDLDPKQFLVSYLVILWGLRLAFHIFFRNRGKGEDPRYQAFRADWKENTWWKSFYKVFMLQGGLMLVILFSIINIMIDSGDYLSKINQFGIVIWMIGWIFETVADYQLLRFKKNPSNKGLVMNRGLWRFSRHPNYFGEVCVWWGVFLISIGSGYWFVSILSPLLITFLLLKVSGVTLLEKRYEGNDKYAEYKRKTSPFFPLPPKK